MLHNKYSWRYYCYWFWIIYGLFYWQPRRKI